MSKSNLKIIEICNPDQLVLLEAMLKPYYMANSADATYYGDSYREEYGAYYEEEKRKANKLNPEYSSTVCNPIYEAMRSIVKNDEALDEWGACGHEIHWDEQGNVYQGALDGVTPWKVRSDQRLFVSDWWVE
tara:strand:- start:327 stop:722 length:396 start_codon:yes stop_codon:yes gene_type:complete